MIVRIRLRQGVKPKQNRRKNRHVALALAALITPAALMACALGCWRIAADLNLTGQFAIPTGLFSHWQVWFSFAAVLEGIAIGLNRYGNAEQPIRNSVEEPSQPLLNSEY